MHSVKIDFEAYISVKTKSESHFKALSHIYNLLPPPLLEIGWKEEGGKDDGYDLFEPVLLIRSDRVHPSGMPRMAPLADRVRLDHQKSLPVWMASRI